jgi:hypothetical protein
MISTYTRHSPSSLQKFAAQPALFVLENVLGNRLPASGKMHRGTAAEAGVAVGLKNQSAPVDDCIQVALEKYDNLMALCADPQSNNIRAGIPAMVDLAIKELRPYGIPSGTQGVVEWHPEGLKLPIFGYYDFAWDDHGILVDLKTTEAMPSKVKPSHARQVAFYAPANFGARVTYVTPKKIVTYQLDDARAYRESMRQLAIRCENFLSETDDPQKLLSKTAPDLESFYWNSAEARAAAFKYWGII